MAKQTILIIEDDDSLGRVMTREFDNAGFDVHWRNEGTKGFQAAKDLRPDVLLLDIMLPGKTGFDILEDLKKDPEGKKIPVIVISMLDNAAEIKKALKLGAEDYFVKSQHALSELVEKVEEFLEKQDKRES